MPDSTPSTPRIAIDFSQLDALNLGNGQYRYVVDLINGLADLKPAAEFVVLGSREQPVAEIKNIIVAGKRFSYVQIHRPKGRFSRFFTQKYMRKLLSEQKVDVYHQCHTSLLNSPPCAQVVTVYDLMYELFDDYRAARNSGPYRNYKAAIQKRDLKVISISHATANDLTRLWRVPVEKISVIRLGTRLNPLPAKLEKSPQPFILSVYNLEPRKNLTSLLRAFSQTVAAGFHGNLILFGKAAVNPEREKKFEAELQQLKLIDRVIRTGFVDDQTLHELYRNAELFVFPSLYEGFGLPLLEAMAAGACVVANDASSMAEIVNDAGVLVDTNKPDILADAIIDLVKNPARRQALGQKARERAAEFSIERMARKTFDVYIQAMDHAKR